MDYEDYLKLVSDNNVVPLRIDDCKYQEHMEYMRNKTNDIIMTILPSVVQSYGIGDPELIAKSLHNLAEAIIIEREKRYGKSS